MFDEIERRLLAQGDKKKVTIFQPHHQRSGTRVRRIPVWQTGVMPGDEISQEASTWP